MSSLINNYFEMYMLAALGIILFLLPVVEARSEIISLVFFLFGLLLLWLMRSKLKLVALVLLGISIINAQWGVAQFIRQRDLNLYLIGESKINTDLAGVAKFGEPKIIRSYGQYPHANVLGGMMVMGAMMWTIFLRRRSLSISTIIIPLLWLGCLVSFSRTAMMGFLILLTIGLYKRVYAMKQLWVMLIITIIFSPMIKTRFFDANDRAWPERIQGIEWSMRIIKNNVWGGIGLNSYRRILIKHVNSDDKNVNGWQLDYVHSALLLYFAKTGVAGMTFILAAVVGIVWKKRYDSKTWPYLLSLSPLLFFDHYLVTQNAPLFSAAALLMMAMRNKSYKSWQTNSKTRRN